ncbi:MAG: hypothetical protein Q9195_003660 [Heterodermia aff. obscurata]
MTDYLTAFTKSVTCRPEESWSTCFLRTTAKEPGLNCSDIYGTCRPPSGSAMSDSKAYYGAWNIWSTWNYLSSWSRALSDIAAKAPNVIKNYAQPGDTDQFLPQHNGVQKVDIALSNMVHMLNKASEPADAAFLRLMKYVPSALVYNATSNSGVNIGNQLQSRLAGLMAEISTDVDSFLKLVEGGEFSRTLNYNVQTIEDAFMPQNASTVSTAMDGGSSVVDSIAHIE